MSKPRQEAEWDSARRAARAVGAAPYLCRGW